MFVTSLVIDIFFFCSSSVPNVFFEALFSVLFLFSFFFNLLSETGGLERVGVGKNYFPIAEIKFQNCVLMKSFYYVQTHLFLPLLPGSRGNIS